MQMEIISDLRERKLQVRTEERKGGYGTELLPALAERSSRREGGD